MLKIRDSLPEGFLSIPARELHRLLDGPTLIRLPGSRRPALFISVLLHGNEDVGLVAVQKLLRKYEGRELPRAINLFVGNVAAAMEGRRRLDGQPDYNRVWPGTAEPESAEAQMMLQLTRMMQDEGLFASIDVHNNTGLNPHYACINRLENPFLHLASLFGRTAVYFIHPRGVQSMAFAEFCPAVTLECGKPGQAQGEEHAFEYLDACLHMHDIPDHPVAEHDLQLFHTVAQVKLPQSVDFSFSENPDCPGLHFVHDLDHMNFRELPAGTLMGNIAGLEGIPLQVRSEHGLDVLEDYFAREADRLLTRKPFMPAMLTLNEEVIRQDCLCYLMERLDWRR